MRCPKTTASMIAIEGSHLSTRINLRPEKRCVRPVMHIGPSSSGVSYRAIDVPDANGADAAMIRVPACQCFRSEDTTQLLGADDTLIRYGGTLGTVFPSVPSYRVGGPICFFHS